MQKHLIGLILTGFCFQAVADDVCFYTDKDYKGSKWCTSSSTSQVPHNDKYSSIKVNGTSLYAICSSARVPAPTKVQGESQGR